MDSPPLTVIEPSRKDRTQPSESGWRLALNGLAVLLFVFAIAAAWQLITAMAAYDRDGTALSWLMGVISALVLMAVALVGESRLAERALLRAEYLGKIDSLSDSLFRARGALGLAGDKNHGEIIVFDRRNRFWYVNDKAATGIGKPRIQIEGQPPMAVLSPHETQKLDLRLAEVRAAAGRSFVSLDPEIDPVGGKTHFIQRTYEVVVSQDDLNGFIVMRADDLTSLIVAKERKEQMFRQVIDTLVAVVDRRDPYASGHSSRVGHLSKAIAAEMGLEPALVDTAEIAGSLMNFGKVLVSRRILTKTTALEPDELQRVRDSILTSADILAIIDFEGPVVATLRQVLERFDGSGEPEGLKGEEILITARIVAVANAFVAFVSPRAHRDGLSFRAATEALERDSGRSYDAQVLLALRTYIETKPNDLDWLLVTKQSSPEA